MALDPGCRSAGEGGYCRVKRCRRCKKVHCPTAGGRTEAQGFLRRYVLTTAWPAWPGNTISRCGEGVAQGRPPPGPGHEL